MKVILQDVVTVGCLLGMRVVRADQSKRTLQMEGSAGMLISSPHASLGTVVRFIPGDENVRQDLYSAQNPAFSHYLERVWGQISVAGRPLNHDDTQRIADTNRIAETNVHSSSMVFVGRRRERESRRWRDAKHNDSGGTKSKPSRRLEHKGMKAGSDEADSATTSVDRRVHSPTYQNRISKQTSQLKKRRLKQRYPDDDNDPGNSRGEGAQNGSQLSHRRSSSHRSEGSRKEQSMNKDREFYRLAEHQKLSASERHSSAQRPGMAAQTSDAPESISGALVQAEAIPYFDAVRPNDRNSGDTWSIQIQSVDSLEFQELRERNAEQADDGMGWVPFPDEEPIEVQGGKCIADGDGYSDSARSISNPLPRSSQDTTDSEGTSDSDITGWAAILADLHETEVFLRRELSEKMRKLRRQGSRASIDSRSRTDMRDLRQEVEEVRAEWQKSQRKIERWERKRPTDSLPQHPSRVNQGKGQETPSTRDTSKCAGCNAVRDGSSFWKCSKTDCCCPRPLGV